jgi:tripartite-type tricarboxylate transporter receptor subunit TctC
MYLMSGPVAPRPHRRALLGLLAAAAPWCAVTRAVAQPYPDRPVRLLVGYPPGGGTDFLARIVATKLSGALGQQVVVLNQPGASGAIALERLVRSPADGHNLIVISAADTILPALRRLPFDMAQDLMPVAPAALGALGLVVHPALPVRTVAELIALARQRPDALHFGSPGVGNSQHLAGEVFNRLAGTRIVHVPFKGGGEVINATVAGDIQVAFPSLAPVMPLVEDGKLRLLAVTTRTRSAAAPAVPSVAEAGLPGYDRATWFGLAAPAGLPAAIATQLNAALSAAMQDAETRQLLRRQGLEPMTATVAEFTAFVRAELAQNAELVRGMNIPAE